MSSDIYESVERLRTRIVRKRLDTWWAENGSNLQLISAAWVSLGGPRPVPLHETAGALASNPSAAVVSARTEDRRGGFIECEVADLPMEFDALRESEIGAVVAVGPSGSDIGVVFDRGPVHLDATTLPWIERRIFDEWVTELRQKREWIDLRGLSEVRASRG